MTAITDASPGDAVQSGRAGVLELHVRGEHYEGHVVIDTVVENRSAGGVRIAEDLPVEEVAALAREMSYKFALFDLPRGGAKAGVRLAGGLDLQARRAALVDFGRCLAPIIGNGIYSPGMDMNCGPDELRAIYRGAGIELGTPTDTSWFTALSVFHALEAGRERLALGDRPCTIAIEGFGSVARHLADRLHPDRYRIVAVATIEGSVLAPTPEGFDPADLSARKRERGDSFVLDLPGTRVERDDVLRARCDVLLPSSRTWVITPAVARGVVARAVVPIANAPYSGDAVAILHAAGAVCLPGYLSNVGGVLASSLFDQGVPRAEIEHLFATDFRWVCDAALALARAQHRPVTDVVEELAKSHLPARGVARRRSLAEKVFDRFLRRRLPRAVRAREARRRFVANATRLRTEIVELENRS